MSDLVLLIISIIAIVILFIVSILIIKKKVTKLSKTIIWFFIPVYIVGWVLYFCAIYSEQEIPLIVKIFQTSFATLKCFALDLNIGVVSNLIKSNIVYAIALCFTWFLASLNTVYILLLALFFGFKDSIRAILIRKKPHYIIILDNFEQLEAINNLNMPSIIILNNSIELKNKARKYSCKKYCFIYNENKQIALESAGINTKGTIVLSLSTEPTTNLLYLNILNEMIPNYNQFFINYDTFDVSKYVNKNKNIIVYSMEDLVARDFVTRYPLYQEIDSSMIDTNKAMLKNTDINHFFLGYNKYSEQLLYNIILNYQMINDKIKLYICDDDAKMFIDQFNGRYFVNKHIQDILKDDNQKSQYFDIEPSRFEMIPIAYEKDSYELKINILNNMGSYNLYYIDYEDDKSNFEKAIELDNFLKNNQAGNYKIYVRFSSNNKFNITELKNRNISIYGDNESILSKRVIIDQSLDELAKMVNYFYSCRYNQNDKDIDSLWNGLSLIDKNSNRFAAMNIMSKLNLLGLTLTINSNEGAISNEEYFNIYSNGFMGRELNMDNYQYDNSRINLGILEHYRWNTFQILNGIHPMKKDQIFKDKKYTRRDSERMLHSNILSLKGLLDLEKYLLNCDFLSLEERNSSSKILIKDFDLMDNLPDILSNTNYKIIRIDGKRI